MFTNRGARLKSWRLKHYLDQAGAAAGARREQPAQPLPFSLRTGDDSRSNGTLNAALYTVSGASDPAPISAPIDLRFEYRDAAGLHAVKEFHLDPTSYVVGVSRRPSMRGDRTLHAGDRVGPGGRRQSARPAATRRRPKGCSIRTSKPQRLAAKDLAKQSTYEGDFKYAGVDDNYFMTVALSPGPSKVTYQPVAIPPPPASKDPPRELVAYAVEPREPASRSSSSSARRTSTCSPRSTAI